MCTLSCVHWQLSLSFVLCPWEKPMSFYNMIYSDLAFWHICRKKMVLSSEPSLNANQRPTLPGTRQVPEKLASHLFSTDLKVLLLVIGKRRVELRDQKRMMLHHWWQVPRNRRHLQTYSQVRQARRSRLTTGGIK